MVGGGFEGSVCVYEKRTPTADVEAREGKG